MNRNALAALAAALATLSAGASASTTFNLSIRGSGEWADWYTHGDPGEDPYVPGYWMGSIVVQTASGADGTYTGSDLELIGLTSNFTGDGFTYHAGDTQFWQQSDIGPDSLVGMEPGASVTIAGGKVASLDFVWDWPLNGGISAQGLTASAHGWFAIYPTMGDVELSGIVHTVPEPVTPAMLLAGLGLVALARRVSKP